MPSMEEIFCSFTNGPVLQLASSSERGWLFCDPELTNNTDGIRQLCVEHHGLLGQLLTHYFGFAKKQLEQGLNFLNKQHGLKLFQNLKRESWCLMQCQSHIRVTETNSIDFSRCQPKMAELCRIYRSKRQGQPVGLGMLALPAPPLPLARPKESQCQSLSRELQSPEPTSRGLKQRITVKSPPSAAVTPLGRFPSGGCVAAASSSSSSSPSAGSALPALFRMDLWGSRKKRKAFEELKTTAASKYQATAQPTAAEEPQEPPSHAPTELDPESEAEALEEHEAVVPLPLGAKVYADHEKGTLVMLYPCGRLEQSVLENSDSGFQLAKFPCGFVQESEFVNDSNNRPLPKAKAKAKGKAKAEAAPAQAEEDDSAPVEPKSKAKAKGKAKEAKSQPEEPASTEGPWEVCAVEGPFTLQSYFKGLVGGKKRLIASMTKIRSKDYHKHIVDLHMLALEHQQAGLSFHRAKQLVLARRAELFENWRV